MGVAAMPQPSLAHPAKAGGTVSFRRGIEAFWRWPVLILGALIFTLPGLVALGRGMWSTEQGAHGPIILCTGLWLLWRETSGSPAELSRRRTALAIAAIVPLGGIAVFASIIGKLWVQWGATYAALVVVYAALFGALGARRAWFPLFYLGFLVPPPPGIIVPLTRALKLGIAEAAVGVLSLLGYQVAAVGASLYVDSYEIVVAAACSGMNSLISLLAVGLLYVFLRHRADWRYALFLAIVTVPVAIVANFGRVILLLLVTHYFGDEAAQGLLHDATGLTTFCLALGTLLLIDLLVEPIVTRWRSRAA